MPRTDDVILGPPPAAVPVPQTRAGWAALGDLNRYQWFVFAVAAIAWMADCMDQQLFNLARKTAITDADRRRPGRART